MKVIFIAFFVTLAESILVGVNALPKFKSGHGDNEHNNFETYRQNPYKIVKHYQPTVEHSPGNREPNNVPPLLKHFVQNLKLNENDDVFVNNEGYSDLNDIRDWHEDKSFNNLGTPRQHKRYRIVIKSKDPNVDKPYKEKPIHDVNSLYDLDLINAVNEGSKVIKKQDIKKVGNKIIITTTLYNVEEDADSLPVEDNLVNKNTENFHDNHVSSKIPSITRDYEQNEGSGNKIKGSAVTNDLATDFDKKIMPGVVNEQKEENVWSQSGDEPNNDIRFSSIEENGSEIHPLYDFNEWTVLRPNDDEESANNSNEFDSPLINNEYGEQASIDIETENQSTKNSDEATADNSYFDGNIYLDYNDINDLVYVQETQNEYSDNTSVSEPSNEVFVTADDGLKHIDDILDPENTEDDYFSVIDLSKNKMSTIDKGEQYNYDTSTLEFDKNEIYTTERDSEESSKTSSDESNEVFSDKNEVYTIEGDIEDSSKTSSVESNEAISDKNEVYTTEGYGEESSKTSSDESNEAFSDKNEIYTTEGNSEESSKALSDESNDAFSDLESSGDVSSAEDDENTDYPILEYQLPTIDKNQEAVPESGWVAFTINDNKYDTPTTDNTNEYTGEEITSFKPKESVPDYWHLVSKTLDKVKKHEILKGIVSLVVKLVSNFLYNFKFPIQETFQYLVQTYQLGLLNLIKKLFQAKNKWHDFLAQGEPENSSVRNIVKIIQKLIRAFFKIAITFIKNINKLLKVIHLIEAHDENRIPELISFCPRS